MSGQPSTVTDTQPSFRKVNEDKVFACEGEPVHVTPGESLLKTGRGYLCPTCWKPVKDVSNTFLGKSYFAFVRTDLGRK